MQQEILRLFASCMKTDVALNNLVVRARIVTCQYMAIKVLIWGKIVLTTVLPRYFLKTY